MKIIRFLILMCFFPVIFFIGIMMLTVAVSFISFVGLLRGKKGLFEAINIVKDDIINTVLFPYVIYKEIFKTNK